MNGLRLATSVEYKCNELSEAMSESLSIGKVAGVSFDQVATAFAKVTKSGMSTSEAGKIKCLSI